MPPPTPPLPVPELNPYAAPTASALAEPPPSESKPEPVTTTIAIWLGLGALNMAIGALFCFVIVRLIPLNLLWVVVGSCALVTTFILVDRGLRERGQLAWSRALRRAALIKAALQLTVLPDMFLGALAAGLTNQILGPGHPLAALPITLLYGGLVAGIIFTIAALIRASQQSPR